MEARLARRPKLNTPVTVDGKMLSAIVAAQAKLEA